MPTDKVLIEERGVKTAKHTTIHLLKDEHDNSIITYCGTHMYRHKVIKPRITRICKTCKRIYNNISISAEYPEHQKLQKIQDKSQSIGEFLEWLGESGFTVCRWVDGYKDDMGEWVPSGYYPNKRSTERLLADFFDIDLKKIEEEKQKMLKELRKVNGQ